MDDPPPGFNERVQLTAPPVAVSKGGSCAKGNKKGGDMGETKARKTKKKQWSLGNVA